MIEKTMPSADKSTMILACGINAYLKFYFKYFNIFLINFLTI